MASALPDDLSREDYDAWLAIESFFDDAFYLSENSDVAVAGINARLHYLWAGWREGRDPSADFSSDFYLATNPDVAAAGINPLLHYVWAGRFEGRLGKRPYDRVRKVMEAAIPSQEKAHFYALNDDRAGLDTTRLVEVLSKVVVNGLIVSTSHDDYGDNFGGVQRLLGEEQAAFAAHGWAHLHLSPARPLPILTNETDPGRFRFSARLAGQFAGTFSAATLLETLRELHAHGATVEFVIHHFMGHSPEFIGAAIDAVPGAGVHFWVHDFYALCPSYNLLRNDVAFCGGPPIHSMGCRICIYGTERVGHTDRIRMFFDRFNPVIIGPSETALSVWKRGGLSHREAHVSPLAKIVQSEQTFQAPEHGPLRIAYVGAPLHHKGWHAFGDLVQRFGTDDRYRFYHFGEAPDGGGIPSAITAISVRAGVHDRDLMTRTIAEHGIDIVVMWPIWPETFCYAVHEALAAGSFVIARRDAGNVWPAIMNHAADQGAAFDTQKELFELFDEGRTLKAYASRPRRRGLILPDLNSSHFVLPRHTAKRDFGFAEWGPLAGAEQANA